jgi:hypothetical protein
MIPRSQVPADFKVTGGVLFVAPPFRHTHFGGRQVVVHDRQATHQEIFAYNLYPGPSAKKGVYSMLLDKGEREGWTTNHCAAVAVVTPYENQLILMHEGASGGGKSEMTEHIHRMEDGRLLIGKNVVTHEERTLNLPEACHLRPIADDMACAHPSNQGSGGRLTVADAENGWFVRVDHIHSYGTAPNLERLCIDPPEPLIFLNHYIVPGGTCLTWEHVEDAPGKAVPQSAGDFAPPHARRHSGRPAARGRAQLRRALPANASRQPALWDSGDDSRAEPGACLAVADGCAARARQPEHSDADVRGDAERRAWVRTGRLRPAAALTRQTCCCARLSRRLKLAMCCCPTSTSARGRWGSWRSGLHANTWRVAAARSLPASRCDEAICPLLGYIPHQLRIEGLDDSARVSRR